MTNLRVLFEEARKKHGFKDPKTNKKVKHYPTDHKRSKLSSTGFYNVKRLKSNLYKQGFCYIYRYHDNGNPKQFSSVDILKLKSKVVNADQEWYVYDQRKAFDLARYHDIDIKALL